MNPFRRTVLLAALVPTASAFASDALRIDAEPAFSGVGADYRTMAVMLENDGPDARGTLRVAGNGSGTSYPVELPHGASKRLIALNNDAGYGSLRLVLDTDRGTAYQTVPGFVIDHSQGGSAILIGGAPGDLAFLRERNTEDKRTASAVDLYVNPEEAPGRATAYAPYSAVVLGPGAERIEDATVAALKDYALGGGTLVILGGTRADAVNDGRWSDVLPGRGWRTKRVTSSPGLARLGGVDVPDAFTVVTPENVAPGASSVEESGASAFQWQRGLGLGRVVVLGYSPLDAPLTEWGGRMRAFAPLVRGGDSLHAHQYVEYYLNQGLNGGQSTPLVSQSSTATSSPANDPFSTRLPDTGTVFGLLAGYFVLVVPVSFLVLRKLKRGELAWVTAPLLSLGFAGALFKSAESLYAAKLSTASQGVVVLQEGQTRAMFYGTSQMFFPRGGDYDLRLRDVDQLTAVRRDDSYGTNALAGFDPVDTGGGVTVPNLEANNLAFREMSFAQRVPHADWFRIDPIDAKHVRVENRSLYRFDGWLVAGDRQGKAQIRLRPGQGTTVEIDSERFDEDKRLSATDPHNFTAKSGRIALTGKIAGFRPGPRIGDEVTSQSGVNVIAFAQEKMP